MKNRVNSVPMLLSRGLIAKAPEVLKIQEKISNRLYGSRASCQPEVYLPALDTLYSRPPEIHTHHAKAFDKSSQSSPSTRVQKLKQTRLFSLRQSLVDVKSRNSIVSILKDIEIPHRRNLKKTLKGISSVRGKNVVNSKIITQRSKKKINKVTHKDALMNIFKLIQK